MLASVQDEAISFKALFNGAIKPSAPDHSIELTLDSLWLIMGAMRPWTSSRKFRKNCS
jgi:hypothetical protein